VTTTTTHVTTPTHGVTVTATIKKSPTGAILPNTGRLDPVGGSDDAAVALAFGLIGLAMIGGAGMVLFRRQAG
jgi:LPXTG-motif cell wall-anchored protein